MALQTKTVCISSATWRANAARNQPKGDATGSHSPGSALIATWSSKTTATRLRSLADITVRRRRGSTPRIR